MARHQNDKEPRSELEERRYQYDLARVGEWRKQQDQLRELTPIAMEVLSETLEVGGPEAVRVALALIKMSDLGGRPVMPDRMLMGLSDDEYLAAGLPDSEKVPRITRGSTE